MMRAPLALPPHGDALRVVLDTNVILSLWHYRHPRLVALRAWLDARDAVFVTSDECLAELARVVALRALGLSDDEQAALVASYRARATRCNVDPTPTLPACRDPDDQKFLALAWCTAAHLLLTRDKRVLAMATRAPWFGRTHVVTPERLLPSLAAE